MTYTSQWLSQEVETRSQELVTAAKPLKEFAPQLRQDLRRFSREAQRTALYPSYWNQGNKSLKKQMLKLNSELLNTEKKLRKQLKKAQTTASSTKREETAQAAATHKAELELALTQVEEARFAFRMLALSFPVFELSSRMQTLEESFENGEIELAYDLRQDAKELIAKIGITVNALIAKVLKSAPIGCTLLPSRIDEGCSDYWGKSLATYVKPLSKPLPVIETLAPNPPVPGPSNFHLRECRVDEIEVVDA